MPNSHKWQKGVTVGLLGLMLFSPVAFASDIESQLRAKEAEMKQIEQRLQYQRYLLSRNKRETTQVLADIAYLDREIDLTEQELQAVTSQLELANQLLAEKTQELQKAEKELAEQNKLTNERVRATYENGTVGYLDVLLSATSFGDFISRLEYLKDILNYDLNLLQEMEIKRADVQAKKEELEGKKAELAALQVRKQQRQQLLASRQAERSRQLEKLKQDRALYEKAENELEAESQRLARELASLKSAYENLQGNGIFKWPLPGYRTISSPFGWRIHPVLKTRRFHTGIDIPAPTGTPVYAAEKGKVIKAGWLAGYGNAIIIDHGGGYTTLYGHNSRLLVSVGQEVEKGEKIALVGSTGWSTGPHLHFEVRKNGEPISPWEFLK